MKRLSLSLAAALAVSLTGGLAASAHAAPGDGIAKACVESFDAAAKKRDKPGRFHAHRIALCACLERQVKADEKIDDATKDKVAVIFTTLAKDRAAGRKLQAQLPRETNRRIGGHARTCTKEAMPKKMPEGDKGKSGSKAN